MKLEEKMFDDKIKIKKIPQASSAGNCSSWFHLLCLHSSCRQTREWMRFPSGLESKRRWTTHSKRYSTRHSTAPLHTRRLCSHGHPQMKVHFYKSIWQIYNIESWKTYKIERIVLAVSLMEYVMYVQLVIFKSLSTCGLSFSASWFNRLSMAV